MTSPLPTPVFYEMNSPDGAACGSIPMAAEKGTRCGLPIRGQDRGCPRNCKRRARSQHATGFMPGRRERAV